MCISALFLFQWDNRPRLTAGAPAALSEHSAETHTVVLGGN
jgi:hypothetical protein